MPSLPQISVVSEVYNLIIFPALNIVGLFPLNGLHLEADNMKQLPPSCLGL